jgi:protein involved in polysaccharide export with SLBB domain
LPVAGIAEPIVPPLKEGPTDFGWEEIGTGGVQSRVIRIPVDKFQAGDPRYNIVIRPGDTIYVPVNIVGEFYVMGNLNRTGPIPLTGRPMTLKMAIATAGGFGPLAWPKRCEIIRRVGKDKEEIVMVDLDKIFSGEQPDFYIKVNDMINVGTHPTARWRAVLRNAFRATYGFGFVYDRNFADRDFGTHRPFPGGLPNLDDLF